MAQQDAKVGRAGDFRQGDVVQRFELQRLAAHKARDFGPAGKRQNAYYDDVFLAGDDHYDERQQQVGDGGDHVGEAHYDFVYEFAEVARRQAERYAYEHA